MSETFRNYLATNGYSATEALPFDGKIHRLQWRGPDAKKLDRTGWFVGFDHGNFQAASWGDWRDGITETWTSVSERRLTSVERADLKAAIAAARAKADEEKLLRQAHVAGFSMKLWSNADCAEDKPSLPAYCAKKQIKGKKLRVLTDGTLLVGLYDADFYLVNLQIIKPDGSKRFLKNGVVEGAHWRIGKMPAKDFDGDLIITEGMATAATLHQITGHTAFAAMNSGNLTHIVKWAREKWHLARLIVAGDDDRWKRDGTPRPPAENVGRIKAVAACAGTRGLAVFPAFANQNSRGTDWNDLAVEETPAVAKTKFEAAIQLAMLDRRLAQMSEAQYQTQRPALIAAYTAAGLPAGVRLVDARRRELRAEDDTIDEDEETPPAILVRIAEEAEFWHDQFSNAYVTWESEGSHQHGRVEGQAFADWLRMQYEDETDSAIPVGKQIFDSVVAQFAARARARCPKFVSHVRCGANGDVHWLDLGRKDWAAVRITSKGWEISTKPEVKFVRSDDDGELPMPVRGDRGLDPLWDIINVAKPDRCLVAGWLLQSLMSTAPVFGLNIYGVRGSAKSNASKYLRRMVDPASALTQSLSEKRLDELAITCRDQWVPVFENVSYLSEDMQDALCRLNTGETDRRRTLYTDFGMTKTFVRRPWIINGINNVCSRGDLAERSIPVQLHVIEKGQRKTEEDIELAFIREWPGLLAALLDATVEALAAKEKAAAWMKARGLSHRMADSTQHITAGESAFGFATGQFLERLTELQIEEGASALDGHPIISVIYELLAESSRGYWNGTLETFTEKVKAKTSDKKIDTAYIGRFFQRESSRIRESLGILVSDKERKVVAGLRAYYRSFAYLTIPKGEPEEPNF